ncbi:MAG TPA: hypothetical protein VGJ60_27910 [Chloroflexota bacterium]|jgi:hypothetical protein
MTTVLANPFGSPLLAPVPATLGVVLALDLIVLCVVERHDMRHLPCSSLFQRWLVWLVIAPTYTPALLSAGLAHYSSRCPPGALREPKRRLPLYDSVQRWLQHRAVKLHACAPQRKTCPLMMMPLAVHGNRRRPRA